MKERIFRFKQFAVEHSRSAMKVGVDGVLIGAWAAVENAKTILDAGCGCGLIALMAAQRNADAHIVGLDIDRPSIEEAAENFSRSPWSERLKAVECDFSVFAARNDNSEKYDLIISNPPFFADGVDPDYSPRIRSRHAGELSPVALITHGRKLLTNDGCIAMIVAPDRLAEIERAAARAALYLRRVCDVISRCGKVPKRIMLELGLTPSCDTLRNQLIIHLPGGEFSEEYRNLTSPFYLKF